MKLNYNHNGENNKIEFSTDEPLRPRVAIQHNNQTWYVPRVAADASNASNFTFWHNGEHFALGKGRNLANMLTYNDDRTAVTLNGTAQVAKDSTKEIFSGDLLKLDYASSVVTIVAEAGANNGELFTVQGNDNNNFIRNRADGAFIIGGVSSDDTYFNIADNATISGSSGNNSVNFVGGVYIFSGGSDTINPPRYRDYKIDFNGATGYKGTLDGSDFIYYNDNNDNTLRILNGLGYAISVNNFNGMSATVTGIARDINSMLTYSAYRTQVTLNGTAQASVSGKILFMGDLKSKDYAAAAVTITACEGANFGRPIYIGCHGNHNNAIIIDGAGNYSIDGAITNNRIPLLSGDNSGKDVIIYSAGQGRDSVWNFDVANDKVQLLNYNASNFLPSVNTIGDVIVSLGSGYVNLKELATDDGVQVTIIGEDGAEFDISGYTYATTFVADKENNVTLVTAAASKGGYAIKADDKTVNTSRIDATPITIDAAAVTGNVTITGVKDTDTISGVALSAIKTSSFDSNGITLGLNNGANLNIITNDTSNAINLDEGGFSVATNYLYQGDANTLTSGFDTWFSAGSDSSTTIFSGFATNNIGLSGAAGNDFITTGKGNDSVFGGGGSNTLAFGGGNDTIFDYVFGNDIINAGVLDIDNGTYDETTGFVTITKDDNNSLSIKLGKTTAPKVTFTDGVNTTVKNYTNIGFFNDDITAVTLKADVRITDDGSIGFIADKLVNDQGLTYSNISTIFADNVYDTMSTKPIIKGLAGVSTFISGGSKVLKLIGGNLADTLESGNCSATLTGGGGSNVFKLGTGAKLITDYTAGDQIVYDEFTIDNISSINTEISGTKLTFDDGSTLELSALTEDTLVTFNGEDYSFRVTDNYQEIITGDKSGVTLLTEDVNIALATEADTIINGATTIVAKNGGIITAENVGGKTFGGGNGITLVGGNGLDTFIYQGGGSGLINALSVTLDGETPVQVDKLIIEGRGIVGNSVNYTNPTEVYITVGSGVLTVNLSGEGATNLDELTVTVNGSEQNLTLDKIPGNRFSDPNNPAGSTGVTVKPELDGTVYGDFGVIGDSLGSGDPGPGTEFYTGIVNITASQENMTLVGNRNNNAFTAIAGRANVFTGGLGVDKFIFKGGGGLITDFGDVKTKAMNKSNLPSSPTATGYNRTDPSTYKQSPDILQVYGAVKNIAYTGFGNATTKNNASFSAYVVYTADIDGTDYVIKLDNIYKYITNYSTKVYRTDDTTIANIFEDRCYDTRSGSLDTLGSVYVDLRSTIADSPYKTLIEEFDAMFAT